MAGETAKSEIDNKVGVSGALYRIFTTFIITGILLALLTIGAPTTGNIVYIDRFAAILLLLLGVVGNIVNFVASEANKA